MESFVAFLLGLFVGSALGWLWARSRAPQPDARLEKELREQVRSREEELVRLRTELAEVVRDRAAAEAERDATRRLMDEQQQLHERTLREQREAHERALREHRETQEKAFRELQEARDKALAEVREAFRALSMEALKESTPAFLQLAGEMMGKLQEAAKGDLAQRQEAIRALVQPLKEQLETYQKRLQQAENQQAMVLGELRKQLEALSQQSQVLAQETQQFRMVLRSSPARGRWGEETLRRVVEAAGMSTHCDFVEQAPGQEGKPDLIVKLPGNRVILVDAKVPDLDFLTALDEADPTRRAAALRDHAYRLRQTIADLARRDYPRQFPNALDHVVLFLPAESLFSAALEGDRELIVWAAERRILLATPASLIALLRSVAVSWQQHAQTENAQKIARAAQELYERVVTFAQHLEKLRSGLERANAAFNEAVGSYHARVRPAGERLMDLSGGASGKELPELQPLVQGFRLPPSSSGAEGDRGSA
ncbi:MAG: DNA recombination protein RmuC [Verrucomicrobiota bacterium]|nr:DNA recombination protein RmuC [Limisphaera sp.]MDW8381242.1 DNA recombination protein RmuC [Verrucomicrobiota bacterium]